MQVEHEQLYFQIAKNLESEYKEVSQGKMMRHVAIKCGDKVFAFLADDSMGFKLGKDFDPESEGVTEYAYLSPFKNKPPMKAWFMIGPEYAFKWEELAEIAFGKMKK